MVVAVEKDGIGGEGASEVLHAVTEVPLHPGRERVRELVLVEVDRCRGSSHPRFGQRQQHRQIQHVRGEEDVRPSTVCGRAWLSCRARFTAPPCIRHFQCLPGSENMRTLCEQLAARPFRK